MLQLSMPGSNGSQTKRYTFGAVANTKLFILLCVTCPLFFSAAQVLAQTEPAATSTERSDITELVIVGRQPGPPMWKVTRGDNELWMFGLLEPLPKELIWESDKVKTVIERSQEYIYIQRSKQKIPLNPFKLYSGMRLLSRLANSSDGSLLKDVVPADQYARFAALVEEYPVRNIEKMRPYFAADALFGKVVRSNGMTNDPGVEKRINRLVRRNRSIKKTPIQLGPEEVDYSFLKEQGERLMQEMSGAKGQECFAVTLDSIETDLNGLKARANAWALGYVDEIRDYQDYPDQVGVCLQVLLSIGDVEDMIAMANQQWLTAIDEALDNNETTFAALGINQLIKPGGLIEQLLAKGYEIREP